MAAPGSLVNVSGDWEQRLAHVVDTMCDMSRQTDPQEMVRAYARRMRGLYTDERFLALSRRDLDPPKYRITRSSTWQEQINPWKEKHRLPLLESGLLGELLYGDEPRIIDELEFAADDPAAEYLTGMRSLMAIPNFDQGIALNMTVHERTAGGIRSGGFPGTVWMSNLFGITRHNLVLADDVETRLRHRRPGARGWTGVDAADASAHGNASDSNHGIGSLPTAHRAGGDYYDFFALPEDKWALLIADVSGHDARRS